MQSKPPWFASSTPILQYNRGNVKFGPAWGALAILTTVRLGLLNSGQSIFRPALAYLHCLGLLHGNETPYVSAVEWDRVSTLEWRQLYPRHLRVLDAREMGVSYRDIGMALGSSADRDQARMAGADMVRKAKTTQKTEITLAQR